MKTKILLSTLFVATTIFVSSCGSTKNCYKGRTIEKMSKKEMEECCFSLKDTFILCGNDTVADIVSWEWEGLNGNVIQEISISLRPFKSSDATELMRYFYTRSPQTKIEINFDGSLYEKQD